MLIPDETRSAKPRRKHRTATEGLKLKPVPRPGNNEKHIILQDNEMVKSWLNYTEQLDRKNHETVGMAKGPG